MVSQPLRITYERAQSAETLSSTWANGDHRSCTKWSSKRITVGTASLPQSSPSIKPLMIIYPPKVQITRGKSLPSNEQNQNGGRMQLAEAEPLTQEWSKAGVRPVCGKSWNNKLHLKAGRFLMVWIYPSTSGCYLPYWKICSIFIKVFKRHQYFKTFTTQITDLIEIVYK